jgi:glycosyltransferase involved in cell wall biosynthesis
VSNAYPPNFIGGAELIAHYQAKALMSLGQSVLVFAGEGQVPGLHYELSKEYYDGVPVWRIFLNGSDFNPNGVNFKNNQIEDSFNRVASSFRPDVVHFHNLIGLSLGLINIAREYKATTFLTIHDNWGICLRNTLRLENGKVCDNIEACSDCLKVINTKKNNVLPIELRVDFVKRQLELIDWFISPSQFQADNYIMAGFPKSAIKVIWNGVDVDRFSHGKSHESSELVQFTFIGYLGEHKGVAVLLNALSLTTEKKIKVNIVGAGHLRMHLEEKCNELGIADKVKFWGKVENEKIESVFLQTDVLVLPSIWPENQPVSITEAMACGIPVIGSAIGGIPELVIDGVTGLLFPSGNSESLAACMDRLSQNTELRNTLGANGRSRIAFNSFFHSAQKLIQLYNAGVRPDAISYDYCVVVDGPVSEEQLSVIKKMRVNSQSLRPFRFISSEWVYFNLVHSYFALWTTGKTYSENLPDLTGLPIVNDVGIVSDSKLFNNIEVLFNFLSENKNYRPLNEELRPGRFV